MAPVFIYSLNYLSILPISRKAPENVETMMDEEKINDQNPPAGGDLLGGDIDLGSEEQPKEPLPEATATQSPTPSTEASEIHKPPAPETQSDEISKVVRLPELKKLTQEAAQNIHVSTLTTVPPGYRLVKTLGLAQTAVLLQAKRIQELRLQKGMQEVIVQLKEEAASQEGNAVLGIQISVTPLGQLYPDSVWITANGTCCVIERRKKRPPKPQEY